MDTARLTEAEVTDCVATPLRVPDAPPPAPSSASTDRALLPLRHAGSVGARHADECRQRLEQRVRDDPAEQERATRQALRAMTADRRSRADRANAKEETADERKAEAGGDAEEGDNQSERQRLKKEILCRIARNLAVASTQKPAPSSSNAEKHEPAGNRWKKMKPAPM